MSKTYKVKHIKDGTIKSVNATYYKSIWYDKTIGKVMTFYMGDNVVTGYSEKHWEMI